MADQTPPGDPFEMFRRLWGPLGVPIPGMAVPTFDPQEVEKRIAELRSVEAWLNMNLNMLKLSINGLELQRAALDTYGEERSAEASVQTAVELAATALWRVGQEPLELPGQEPLPTHG